MSILISYKGVSTVVLTLAEKSKLAEPFYTFRVESKENNEEFVFCATDISSYPSVYNKFAITVSESSSPLSGVISIAQGQYNYYVYESAEPGILDISECANLVETGILYVKGPKQDTKTFEAPTTVKVWGQ